jgi:hypothetical protein
MVILVQMNVKTKHGQLKKIVRKTQETCSNWQIFQAYKIIVQFCLYNTKILLQLKITKTWTRKMSLLCTQTFLTQEI